MDSKIDSLLQEFRKIIPILKLFLEIVELKVT